MAIEISQPKCSGPETISISKVVVAMYPLPTSAPGCRGTEEHGDAAARGWHFPRLSFQPLPPLRPPPSARPAPSLCQRPGRGGRRQRRAGGCSGRCAWRGEPTRHHLVRRPAVSLCARPASVVAPRQHPFTHPPSDERKGQVLGGAPITRRKKKRLGRRPQDVSSDALRVPQRPHADPSPTPPHVHNRQPPEVLRMAIGSAASRA